MPNEAEELTERYFKILDELFFGIKNAKNKTSALEQLAKVRHVEYEIWLYRHFRIPPYEIAGWAKAYFCNAVMDGQKMEEMGKRDLDCGLVKMYYRIQSCRKRCTRLVEELNDVMGQMKLQTVDVDSFIDYMTFHYSTVADGYGGVRHSREYGYEIRYFSDEYSRENFKDQLSLMKRRREVLSMQDVFRRIKPPA